MEKIPNIVHYCWFGQREMPALAKNCLESWKKFLPDYFFILWNEYNFDINSVLYVKQAYEKKKYAFVTDYVRLYALYNFGGIYMDTDVEVVKNLDDLLSNDAFTGFESSNYPVTATMGAKPKHPMIKEFLDIYENKSFINPNGSLNMQTNTVMMSDICKKHGVLLNNSQQIVNGLTIYPQEYFCPAYITKNTHTIHRFAGSWIFA